MFLGHSGGLDTDGNELPRLVYVSREKRPGFQHHKKAGAMNALVCYSLLTIVISVSFSHYITIHDRSWYSLDVGFMSLKKQLFCCLFPLLFLFLLLF